MSVLFIAESLALKKKGSPSTSFKPEYEKLSQMEAVTIAAILEDAIDELTILGFTKGKPTIDFKKESFEHLDRKLQLTRDHMPIFHPEINRPMKDAFETLTPIKFQKDREFIKHTLSVLKKEIFEERTMAYLKYVVLEEKLKGEQEKELLDEVERNMDAVSRLEKLLDFDKDDYHKTKAALKHQGLALQEELEGAVELINLQKDFVTHWEFARKEQNDIRLGKQESELKDKMIEALKGIGLENRVHSEIKGFILEDVTNKEQMIEYWMETYDNDVEDMDLVVAKARNAKDDIITNLEDMKEEYARRDLFIEEYSKVKNEINEIIAMVHLTNKKAIKIQRWWRKTMYEKKLGAFRRKTTSGKIPPIGKKPKNKPKRR